LVGLLLSLWLAFILADRLGKPISKLAGATQSLREGSLETRVEVPENSASEIRNLVDSFNHMAEDLRHSREKLVQAERVATWREIARGLAHELKNPLTPILGALQVVERAHQKGREDFDEILSEQAEAVKEEVHRLKNMADNFSRFAKLPEPKPEQLNLMDVLDKALTLYGESNPGVLIKRAFEPEAITMLADRDRLGTVFSNLVKNGVEAMEGEGVLGVSAGIEGEACWVRIQDSGPGVAETVRDRLFTPYITTKAQGTGLGLALVHRIVTEMNGEIQLVDCEGVGACFEITLPRSPV